MDKPGQIQARVQVEGSQEGKMARSELYRAAKYSMKLFQMIQEGQELEGWVQAKITKSADYLDSVYHYMEYHMKFGSGAEATSVDDITGEASVINQKSSDDEGTEMKENLNYEQELKSLLEGAIKKLSKKKNVKENFGQIGEEGVKHFADKIAEIVYAENPNLNTSGMADEFLSAAFPHLVKAMGSTRSANHWLSAYDGDNEADLVTAYARLKRAGGIGEGWDDMIKAGEKRRAAEKGSSKFDVKKTSTGTVYTRKSSTYDDGGDDSDVKKAKKKAKKTATKESLVKTVVKRVAEAKKGSKPDFLDIDKDGDKKEPMKKAVADKKKGSAPKKGVNPFAKKNESVKEGIPANYKTSALKAAASKDLDADKKSGVPANYKTSTIKAELGKKSKVKESSDLNDILKLAGRRPLVD